MKIKASQTSNRVLIKQQDAEKVVGNLIIPETIGEKPAIGLVKGVSEFFMDKGVMTTPIVKEGDTVQYNKHSGIDIEIDDEATIGPAGDDRPKWITYGSSIHSMSLQEGTLRPPCLIKPLT